METDANLDLKNRPWLSGLLLHPSVILGHPSHLSALFLIKTSDQKRDETRLGFLSFKQCLHGMQDGGWKEGKSEKRQEGVEEKEKMKTEEREEGNTEYMVRSNTAFSGETKFTLPYSYVCVCVCMSTWAGDTKFVIM